MYSVRVNTVKIGLIGEFFCCIVRDKETIEFYEINEIKEKFFFSFR